MAFKIRKILDLQIFLQIVVVMSATSIFVKKFVVVVFLL